MANKLRNLRELLEYELRDLYSAETQLTEALPKMAESAQNPELKEAFKSHLEETKNQVTRLHRIGEILDTDLGGEKCEAMKGLIKEGEEVIKHKAEPEVHDAALIAAAQRVEHYEIAGYGTVARYAELLNLSEVQNLLGETLSEEKEADQKLNMVASTINQHATV